MSQRYLQGTRRTDSVLDVACGRSASTVIWLRTSVAMSPEWTTRAENMAAMEMARVLRRRGRLGITDITVDGILPDDVQTLLAWVACVAGAGLVQDYISILEEAGFAGFTMENKQGALQGLVEDIRRKLRGLNLVAGLGKLELGGLDLNSGNQMARYVVELI